MSCIIWFYGNDDHPKYDGLHMYGPQGHATFQASVLNILKNAGFVKSKKNKVKPASPDDLPYSPMRMFREKITVNTQNLSTQPNGIPTTTSKTSAPNTDQQVRPSVFRRTNLQAHYSVPVSNPFQTLGN